MNPLSDRLRRVCATHRERVAVLDRGRAFTYAELEQRVRDIEARLLEGGVTRGVLVALGGPRTFTRIADLVALFRAGAVPLLLCPRWPRAYRDACLARSGATHRLEDGVLTRVVAEQPPEAQAAPLPDDAAYLIYTSGSSGSPKGVLVPHAGLVAVLDAQIEAFSLTPASRSLFLLGLGFDASLSDIGTSLLAGATLVLEDDVACAPSALLTTAAQRHVTYADVPPAYLAHLDAGALPACLTTLVVGGEVAPEADVRRLAGQVALFNVYGPTEATICTSLGRCDTAWSRPLLGRPIAGNTYTLSPHPGAAAADDGELLIAGPGLALGYHRDAGLTSERFVERDGRRWFRTGDRVRRHADGEWEFLGRIDRQLKRRGQLVAPEEVEAALRGTGWVRAASVSVSADGQRLLARVEAPADHAVEADLHLAARLREALRAQLPAGLVPDGVQVVRELPRGTTGKLLHADREPARDPLPAPLAAPHEGNVPLQLIAAWMGEALGLAPLGPDEDFFDAGGTSLHALELSARAAAAGLGVAASTLAQGRTPRRVVSLAATETAREWSRAHLEPRLGAFPSLRAVPAGSLRGAQVLLTGATGTLGRALLPRLLRALGPAGRVHCVVRRPDALDDGLDAAGSEPPPMPRDPRVALHVGDVVETRFGLAADRYAGLADEVDVVIHLAARLTAAASLDALLAVNLEGTRHALQLCADGRPKALLHASTLSVFADSLPHRAVCLEDDDLSALDALLTPYAASKWLAERLIHSADPHAHAATVVRFGLLTGAAEDGLGAHDGHLARVIRGLARLGALPAACVAEGSSLAFDVTPLDHAADTLLALLRHDREAGSAGTYHVAAAQPATLADLVLAMHAEDIPLSPLSTSAFFARAGEHPDPSGDVALAALSVGRALPGMLAHHRALDLFAATGAHFSLVNTTRALASSLPPGALAAPRPDHALLRRYVRAAVA